MIDLPTITIIVCLFILSGLVSKSLARKHNDKRKKKIKKSIKAINEYIV